MQVVGELVCLADIVDEALDRPERLDRLGYELFGRRRLGEVAHDAERSSGFVPGPPDPIGVASADHHPRTLGRQQPGGLQTDPPGRAGDDADAVPQAEVQGRVV